jgi:hypothetical protein
MEPKLVASSSLVSPIICVGHSTTKIIYRKKLNPSSLSNSKKNFKNQGRQNNQASSSNNNQPRQGGSFSVPPDTCLYYKKTCLYKRKCPEFLQFLLESGKDQVTFVNESLYLEYPSYSWWIVSGATVHVANSLKGLRTSQRLTKGRRTIRWQMELKQQSRPLEIYILIYLMVLYCC